VRRERERWLEEMALHAQREGQTSASTLATAQVREGARSLNVPGPRITQASGQSAPVPAVTAAASQSSSATTSPSAATSTATTLPFRTAVSWGQAAAAPSPSGRRSPVPPSTAVGITWGLPSLPPTFASDIVAEPTQSSSSPPRGRPTIDSAQEDAAPVSAPRKGPQEEVHSTAEAGPSTPSRKPPPPPPPPKLPINRLSMGESEVASSAAASSSVAGPAQPAQPHDVSATDTTGPSNDNSDEALNNSDRAELGRRHSLLLSRPLRSNSTRRAPPPVPPPRRARVSPRVEEEEEAGRGGASEDVVVEEPGPAAETPAAAYRRSVVADIRARDEREAAAATAAAPVTPRRPAPAPPTRPLPTSPPANPSLLTYIPSPDRRSLPDPVEPEQSSRSGSGGRGSIRALISRFEGQASPPSPSQQQPRRRPPPPPPICTTTSTSASRRLSSSSPSSAAANAGVTGNSPVTATTPSAALYPQTPRAAVQPTTTQRSSPPASGPSSGPNPTVNAGGQAVDRDSPTTPRRKSLPNPPSSLSPNNNNSGCGAVDDAYTVFCERAAAGRQQQPDLGSSVGSSSAAASASSPPAAVNLEAVVRSPTLPAMLRPPLRQEHSADSVSLQEEGERPSPPLLQLSSSSDLSFVEGDNPTPSSTADAAQSSSESQLRQPTLEITDLDLMIAGLEGAEDGSRYEVCLRPCFPPGKKIRLNSDNPVLRPFFFSGSELDWRNPRRGETRSRGGVRRGD
jgi:hypothetical protein